MRKLRMTGGRVRNRVYVLCTAMVILGGATCIFLFEKTVESEKTWLNLDCKDSVEMLCFWLI